MYDPNDPAMYGGVDPKTLPEDERERRWGIWYMAELARLREEPSPFEPGDLSEVKMRDVLGNADVRGMTDYRKVRETEAREARQQEADKTDEGRA